MLKRYEDDLGGCLKLVDEWEAELAKSTEAEKRLKELEADSEATEGVLRELETDLSVRRLA